MSLFLSRLRLGKEGLVRRSSLLILSNGLSSSSLHQSPPCNILGAKPCGEGLGKLIIKNANERDPTEPEKKVPMELVYNNHGNDTIVGASHGWIATLKNDGILRLQDDLNPYASYTEPKHIPLPPLVTMRHCQTKIITNVSMSSSFPDDDETCVVAAKFLGAQLSFCKPASQSCKPEWTNIRIKNPCFYSSRVVFSKKEEMFRIVGYGGHLIGSWDPCKPSEDPKLQTLHFQKLPKLPKSTRELMDSCCKSERLVESPTGETFLVKMYRKTAEISKGGIAKMKTRALMVFKIDEEGNAVYTQDIGDLVIFLSDSEPFCALAASFPGLHSNHVEFLEAFNEVAYIDLSGHAFISYIDSHFPAYYIPPQKI
ncbi:PREDICTED: uncharacterized protein LOC106323446 [Brassica oleracea var. oleracea]|uniref:KIB1-4 beta-propeller domain-containing protein n=1 Tax=Brassica oleracea var. oleracea TaxID=109376 RepID=A0A0D3AM83_BRAOL|nr:PREDICTED: uncharacterized protein LOC106323446 [Brassica oleracea var. oleracea]